MHITHVRISEVGLPLFDVSEGGWRPGPPGGAGTGPLRASASGSQQAGLSGGSMEAAQKLPTAAVASQPAGEKVQKQRGNPSGTAARPYGGGGSETDRDLRFAASTGSGGYAAASPRRAAIGQPTSGHVDPQGTSSNQDAATTGLGPPESPSHGVFAGSSGARSVRDAQPFRRSGIQHAPLAEDPAAEMPRDPFGAPPASEASPAASEPLRAAAGMRDPPAADSPPGSAERLAVQAMEAATAALVLQDGGRSPAAGSWDPAAATPPVASSGRWKPVGSSVPRATLPEPTPLVASSGRWKPVVSVRRSTSPKSTPLMRLSAAGLGKSASGDRGRGAQGARACLVLHV